MSLIAHPLVPLVVFSGATTVALCAMVVPLPTTKLLLDYTWAFLFLIWMQADARRLRKIPCYDFGLFITVFYPLSLVWYCFWSRG